MNMKRTFTAFPSDYTSVVEWLNNKNYKFNVIWDGKQELFTFTYESDENYYIACMNDLADLRNSNILSYEEKDALNTGINAIKQLIDMGVLE